MLRAFTGLPQTRIFKCLGYRNNDYFKNNQEFTEAIKTFLSEKLPKMADKIRATVKSAVQPLEPCPAECTPFHDDHLGTSRL